MPPALPRPSARPGASKERGAALLIAISAIAILTAVGVDLAYNTRVELQRAADARDELRATYLAKSAVNVARLVLHFQQQVDQASGAMAQAGPGLLAQLQGQSATQSSTAAAASPLAGLLGGGGLAIRLWDLVPVDSAAAALFLGGPSAGPSPAAAPAVPGASGKALAGAASQEGTHRLFGDVDGAFHATIEDEERKINLRQLDGLGYAVWAQAARLADLVKDPRWDFLFDEDDANGLRVSRKELFAALKDWEDLDETLSVFTGDPAKPFDNGFGDENYLYDRLDDHYKAKNAPYDSQDELYMVAGVSDAFMAAFGDKLTVYPDVGAKINVNSTDPAQLMLNAVLMSDPPGVPQPALADPAFLQKLSAALALVRPLPFMSITPQQFASVLVALGVRVDPLYQQSVNSDSRSPFGNTSSTFSIHAVGTAGGVTKRIEAVVTFDRRAEALAQDLGRLLHWHEE
ncbi:MAG TPA: hypothetical protein VMG32_00855 [Anaeromyxobacteraceae bacterium]|nr:hypothetical protein [Anaeromyxobacteraceae bacterium]